MRIKFGPFGGGNPSDELHRDDRRWRCCLCCHVRTGTIFLGIWHLGLNILALAVIAVVVLHPEVIERKDGNFPLFPGNDLKALDDHALLPTPLSETKDEFPFAFSEVMAKGEPRSLPHQEAPDSRVFYGSFVYRDWFGDRRAPTYQDLNVGVGVTFCTLAITLLMLYGAVRGKHTFLMPFFCLQVFDFCVSSLSVIGYLSYVPDIRVTLMANPNIPMRNELLAMDPQCLSLLVLSLIFLTMLVKAYFISIVWGCYKYLVLRSALVVSRPVLRVDSDGQTLLHENVNLAGGSSTADLPDYVTAMNDPRFSKKPLYPTPPPPYAAVVVDLPPEQETLPASPSSSPAAPSTLPSPVSTDATSLEIAPPRVQLPSPKDESKI